MEDSSTLTILPMLRLNYWFAWQKKFSSLSFQMCVEIPYLNVQISEHFQHDTNYLKK